jgi:hypothetical protein
MRKYNYSAAAYMSTPPATAHFGQVWGPIGRSDSQNQRFPALLVLFFYPGSQRQDYMGSDAAPP